MARKEIARRLKDGTVKILSQPHRGQSPWHRPLIHVPSIQWAPETGKSRWAFARERTPEVQRDFWEEMAGAVAMKPPRAIPPQVVEALESCRMTLPDGTQGYGGPLFDRLKPILAQYEIRRTSPCGLWKIFVSVQRRWGFPCDIIGISHTDYRTLPDWELIVRARAWLLTDDRAAHISLPGFSSAEEFGDYQNARFNCIQITAPRNVSGGGEESGPKTNVREVIEALRSKVISLRDLAQEAAANEAVDEGLRKRIGAAVENVQEPTEEDARREPWRCASCDGKNIETPVWSDPNSGTVFDDTPGAGGPWCHDCNDHVKITNEPQKENRNGENDDEAAEGTA